MKKHMQSKNTCYNNNLLHPLCAVFPQVHGRVNTNGESWFANNVKNNGLFELDQIWKNER
jgi:hypothetical protein